MRVLVAGVDQASVDEARMLLSKIDGLNIVPRVMDDGQQLNLMAFAVQARVVICPDDADGVGAIELNRQLGGTAGTLWLTSCDGLIEKFKEMHGVTHQPEPESVDEVPTPVDETIVDGVVVESNPVEEAADESARESVDGSEGTEDEDEEGEEAEEAEGEEEPVAEG